MLQPGSGDVDSGPATVPATATAAEASIAAPGYIAAMQRATVGTSAEGTAVGPMAGTVVASASVSASSIGGGGIGAGDAIIVDAAATIAALAVGVGAQVRVLQRVAAFLQPQDAAYFEAGNRAVAVYDYTYTLTRIA